MKRSLLSVMLVSCVLACGGPASQSKGDPDGASARAEAAPRAQVGDLADGDAGGPDFWMVTGEAGAAVDLRDRPAGDASVIASVEPGTTVRNLGCRIEGDERWCRIGMRADDGIDGWVPGGVLRETAVPAGGQGEVLQERAGADVPRVYRRGSGEYEVAWEGGCTVLLGASGGEIQAGASCSEQQRTRSAEIVGEHQGE